MTHYCAQRYGSLFRLSRGWQLGNMPHPKGTPYPDLYETKISHSVWFDTRRFILPVHRRTLQPIVRQLRAQWFLGERR